VVIFPSWFTFDAKMVNYKVIPWGANFLHIWDFEGSFSFNHYDVGFGSPFLLGTNFERALLTSLSPSATQRLYTMGVNALPTLDAGWRMA
jgi:hypothetical protein